MEPIYRMNPYDTEYGNYIDEYRAWMYTPCNAFKCAECPARNDDRRMRGYPCGQQNCWVEVTCHPEQFRW